MLQDRFKNTDWNMFTHTDLDQYASSVLDHISTTIDSVTTQKQITMYPNQKPWMNRDVRLLLKARNTAFRSGDAQAYSTARAELKRGIKKAKHRYKGKLNNFYARFERGNTATATKAAVTPDHQPLTLSPDDVGAVLGRIVVHKAAGPDGIPGRVLRACSGELAEASVPSCATGWLLDFLTSRPQHVRLDNHCSSTITINTGVPQGCVMSPFLYSLLTHDCRPADSSNTIIKFADDTTVIGLIKDSDEAAYREEVDRLAEWCDTNNLLLNTGKTKELIVDFRRNADPHTPIHIKGMTVERVNSFKFLGVHISEDLTWTTGCSKLVKKAHQRLFFLRTLRKNHLSSDILVNFYRCTIESILTSCITVWYGSCSAADRKALQRVVKAAQRIAGAPLPRIEDIYRKRCLKRAGKIIKDSSHPAHRLFTLLPSGKRYRSARTKTTRLNGLNGMN
ncbi:hypothetical protein L3Q82_008055 [Scortum barcoo]|uniref:Uncharacterized protein n=1 Tax=Scortum barcoo TaxID=214431 RepID=A0ACB8WL03_9TELE|nr:hypothetical protein L3Q82_008055 [Scortum barcoo]